MQYSNETPRREITISGVVLKVVSPYTEGHQLTAEEAHVLNQTLAENLRNNFATRVKEVKEKSEGNVDTQGLQTELDNYMTEYKFGAGRQAAVAVDPITKLAIAAAKEAVKAALIKAGKNAKDYTADQIAELAQRAVDTNPRFREIAQQQYDLKKAAAIETLGDLAA